MVQLVVWDENMVFLQYAHFFEQHLSCWMARLFQLFWGMGISTKDEQALKN